MTTETITINDATYDLTCADVPAAALEYALLHEQLSSLRAAAKRMDDLLTDLGAPLGAAYDTLLATASTVERAMEDLALAIN